MSPTSTSTATVDGANGKEDVKQKETSLIVKIFKETIKGFLLGTAMGLTFCAAVGAVATLVSLIAVPILQGFGYAFCLKTAATSALFASLMVTGVAQTAGTGAGFYHGVKEKDVWTSFK